MNELMSGSDNCSLCNHAKEGLRVTVELSAIVPWLNMEFMASSPRSAVYRTTIVAKFQHRRSFLKYMRVVARMIL